MTSIISGFSCFQGAEEEIAGRYRGPTVKDLIQRNEFPWHLVMHSTQVFSTKTALPMGCTQLPTMVGQSRTPLQGKGMLVLLPPGCIGPGKSSRIRPLPCLYTQLSPIVFRGAQSLECVTGGSRFAASHLTNGFLASASLSPSTLKLPSGWIWMASLASKQLQALKSGS